jgi:hypothetical protein
MSLCPLWWARGGQLRSSATPPTVALLLADPKSVASTGPVQHVGRPASSVGPSVAVTVHPRRPGRGRGRSASTGSSQRRHRRPGRIAAGLPTERSPSRFPSPWSDIHFRGAPLHTRAVVGVVRGLVVPSRLSSLRRRGAAPGLYARLRRNNAPISPDLSVLNRRRPRTSGRSHIPTMIARSGPLARRSGSVDRDDRRATPGAAYGAAGGPPRHPARAASRAVRLGYIALCHDLRSQAAAILGLGHARIPARAGPRRRPRGGPSIASIASMRRPLHP